MKNKIMYNLNALCKSEKTNLKDAINAECLLDYMYESLSETLVWEYYTSYAYAFHKSDTSNHTEITFDSSTRKVSKLFDHRLSQDDTEQNTSRLQPTLRAKANRIN